MDEMKSREFCGIRYLDSVLCSYPYESKDVLKD